MATSFWSEGRALRFVTEYGDPDRGRLEQALDDAGCALALQVQLEVQEQ